MISNDSSAYYGHQPYRPQRFSPEPRPQILEETLDRSEIKIEQKSFVLMLKENSRGRFLRVVEQSGEYRQSILIPSTGLDDFLKILAEMVDSNAEFPPANAPAVSQGDNR